MNRFRYYRLRAGLTQQDVALALNISQVSVWQWESGMSMPRADKLTTIAELYKCEVTDLLEKEESA